MRNRNLIILSRSAKLVQGAFQMFPDISFYDVGNQHIFGVASFKHFNPGQETLLKKLENDHVTPK